MLLKIHIWWILGSIFLAVFVFIITFFILMAEGVLRRTDKTVRIERIIEDLIGGITRLFLHGNGVLAKQIEASRLKFKCSYCSYLDDVDREYCLNCLRNKDGLTIEQTKPYKCTHCHSRFEEQFRYCPKCSKNEKGHTLGINH